MVFFTLLLDESTPLLDIFALLYDLKLEPSVSDLFQAHLEKLLGYSQSLQSWNRGPYAHCIRIVNSETISVLRRYWSNYSNPINMTRAFTQKCDTAIKKIYNRHYKNVK